MNANLQKTKYQVEGQTVNSDFFYWLKIFVESYELIINSMQKNVLTCVIEQGRWQGWGNGKFLW